MSSPAYLGIDPGVSGAMIALVGDDVMVYQHEDDERGQWDWLAQFIGVPAYAVIEQQTARPTNIPQKDPVTGKTTWRQTVLASTVSLYGGYRALRAMLVCGHIAHDDCPPAQWQKWLEIRRDKGEKDGPWKNRLKDRAQQLFPAIKVTLGTADALLIAYYCRSIHGGSEIGG